MSNNLWMLLYVIIQVSGMAPWHCLTLVWNRWADGFSQITKEDTHKTDEKAKETIWMASGASK